MFDVLVYLYETYYRPDACPDSAVLVKKLSAIGFEEEEISEALDWLADLAETTSELAKSYPQQVALSFGTRVYVPREINALGLNAVGVIQFLESARIITPIQREIVIAGALAASDGQLSLDKLKVIVLMMLWSQGMEPDGLIFDELFDDQDGDTPCLLH